MYDYGFSPSRLAKRANLIRNGVDPYPAGCSRSHFVGDVLTNPQLASEEVDLVGRLIAISSEPSCLTVEDVSGSINIQVDNNARIHNSLILNNLDVGDFIGARGIISRCDRNVVFLQLRVITILTKALKDLPNPEEWIKSKEFQRRERYVDLAIRRKAREIFQTRVRLIRNIRHFLDEQGMCEIETPILRSWYDIVCFDQFTTNDTAGRPLYMRLCHEDRLKQLISGGFEKVYELGRSFRRDNASWKHSPEFLQLETIQAYSDYKDMMKHAEDLISIVTQRTLGRTTIQGRQGNTIDLSPPWKKISVRDAILQYAGIDIYKVTNPSDMHKDIKERTKSVSSVAPLFTIAVPPADNPAGSVALPPEPYCNWFWGLVEHCVGVFVEPNLIQPTILFDYPLDSNWLVKRKRDRPDYIERFEAYIDGIEIANCYTLVNDPIDFTERLEDQLGWYCKAFGQENRPLDLSLISAKAYGLPPMSESSFGIDRWLMIICEQEAIQDVIWMPYPYI